MACFQPVTAWRSKFKLASTGKAHIVFKRPSSKSGFEFLPLPCGQCSGCLFVRSRNWALRCWHESKMHAVNCFVTLTFDDAHLDKSGSLDKRDFVLFMKRLRKKFFPRIIRFFHCGEYGSKNRRPHHHVLLFGFDFFDKREATVRNGKPLYTSEVLSELWPFGFSSVGDVSFDSAAYVAGYCLKKFTAKEGIVDYGDLLPEYVSMSRRPGIGRAWLDTFQGSDCFPQDFVVTHGGYKFSPPKYYSKCFELTHPEEFDIIRAERIRKVKLSPDNSFDRLKSREAVQIAKINLIKKEL